jgi:hypothetical protein
MKKLLISILLFTTIFSAAQNKSIKNNWANDKLKSSPLKIIEKTYGEIEKFGESIEELIDTRTTIFNETGFHISIVDEINPNINSLLEPFGYDDPNYEQFEAYNSTKTFSYENNSNCLKETNWQKNSGRSKGKCYKVSYSCNENQVEEVIGAGNCSGNNTLSFTFYKKISSYDKFGNEIRTEYFDKGGNTYEIWIRKYNSQQKVTEENCYDGEGYLNKRYLYKYDLKSRLVEQVFQDGKDEKSPTTHKNVTTNKYDEKDNIIFTQTINYTGDNSKAILDHWSSGSDYYTWYKNEYYQTGLLKNVTKYIHSNGGSDKVQNLTNYKKYDNQNNWTEKIIYSECYNETQCLTRYKKYLREIEY